MDTPDFPAQWQASALGARDALNLMREEKALDWTMLSPSAYIHPGERTGTFRLGDERLLVGAEGKSDPVDAMKSMKVRTLADRNFRLG